jgi:hypothetical protein
VFEWKGDDRMKVKKVEKNGGICCCQNTVIQGDIFREGKKAGDDEYGRE